LLRRCALGWGDGIFVAEVRADRIEEQIHAAECIFDDLEKVRQQPLDDEENVEVAIVRHLCAGGEEVAKQTSENRENRRRVAEPAIVATSRETHGKGHHEADGDRHIADLEVRGRGDRGPNDRGKDGGDETGDDSKEKVPVARRLHLIHAVAFSQRPRPSFDRRERKKPA